MMHGRKNIKCLM